MIYIFDICNTLYNSNTTYDFIRYFFQKKKDKPRLKLFDAFTSRESLFYYLFAVLSKLTKSDIHKSLVINLLEGYRKDDLYEIALEFYDEVLEGRKIQEVFDILEEKDISENEIVLVSSTIDPVGKAIQQRLGKKVITTELLYDNNICLGKLSKELSGKKERYAPVKKDEKYGIVTDNLSDYKLVSGASEKVIIIYKEKDKKKWKKLSPVFISPGV